MSLREIGAVGILPAGALGVAFFHHLTHAETDPLGRVVFLEREGSTSGSALRKGASLRIATSQGVREIHDAKIWRPSLMECAAKENWLPELVLVCTQPDQLLGVIGCTVQLFEFLCERYPETQAVAELPALILCSNGIYFQRVRQFLIEKLEEGTLFGRLPDLWPDLMPRIVGKLLRGVTIQTGQREGSGAAALYRPGPRGRTRLAGGDRSVRERCAGVLTSLGGWFEVADDASPTRVEFDKALINLTVNLLGQIAAIDAQGHFRPLTIGEILRGESRDDAEELARRVIEVGRAVHAYRPDEHFDCLWAGIFQTCRELLEHVPSSLQWIEMQLQRGALEAHLTPTETWLLEPLIRYARAAGLEDAAHYFEQLTHRVESKLALAVAAQKKKGET